MNGSARRIFFTAFLLFAAALGSLSAREAAGSVTKRLGLFVGSNNGGRGRVTLRYAVNDARAVSRIFADMGGIAQGDNVLLVEPTVAEINRNLDTVGRALSAAKNAFQRTELVFYYSGHSDEEGLLLNRERYSYRDLRERINRINTDMRIVILDSCSSGAITRAKGGVKTPPFLFDSSVSVEGYAFLTSSSADETSQESDSIESSYFTHSLMAGLRGAADTVGDGKVTLNELYRFAYTETLAKTETSIYGVQHPSYDMQVSGSGDVILTDITETSASLLLDGELTGRITIRDSFDLLVAELTKVNQKPMELGLEPGLYRVTIQRGDNFYRSEVLLRENNRTPLTLADFTQVASTSGNRNRGDDAASGDDVPASDAPLYPVNFQLLPGKNLLGHNDEKGTNHLLLGLLAAKGHNVLGLAAAPIGVINSGYVRGVQASGIFNTLDGDLEGVQASGVFNWAEGKISGVQAGGIFNIAGGNIEGVQTAGIFNIANGNNEGVQVGGIFNIADGYVDGAQVSGLFNRAEGLTGSQTAVININKGNGGGVQLGVVNISESENVIPIGLVNVVKNGMIHPSIFIDDMLFLNAGLRSGTKRFYTHFSMGLGGGFLPGRNGDDLTVWRAGFGFEFPLEKFFVDIDLSAGNIINWSAVRDYAHDRENDRGNFSAEIYQLRLTGGYKIFEHLGIFAGVSYDWIRRHNSSSPDPKDFAPFMLGKSFGQHTHKVGFFAGVQF